ncbi:hypothetical protein [Flavobacterium sp.]|uniref:hypothetical protein n=1 Tax=Flavobacterium sp. TaxID=239 RepID=UPI0022BFB76D|nr:hypothetical protein [Flavobacterium sp.]MCZ8168832.1 hypothetical protein [Flavobacterium sp.]
MPKSIKKYQTLQDDDVPHVGQRLNQHVKTVGIKKAFIQRALDVNHTTISRYFRQHSIQVAILWRFSRILKFNFFMALGEQLQIPYTTQAEKELRNTLHLKNHEIELLQAKVHYLESLLKKT